MPSWQNHHIGIMIIYRILSVISARLHSISLAEIFGKQIKKVRLCPVFQKDFRGNSIPAGISRTILSFIHFSGCPDIFLHGI